MLKMSVPHARTCVRMHLLCKTTKMLGRVRVFSSVRRKEESKHERERERVVDKKQEVEPTPRICYQLAGVAAVAGWPGERRRVFSTSRGCLRKREEREYGPSFQVEIFSQRLQLSSVFFFLQAKGLQQELIKSRSQLQLDPSPLPHPRFQL